MNLPEQKYLIAIGIVAAGIVGAGISSTNLEQGSLIDSPEGDNSNSINTEGGFSFQTASIAGGCDGTSANFEANCYSSTNDDWATAEAILYLGKINDIGERDDGVKVVEPDTRMRYKCVEVSRTTKALYINGQDEDPDIEWSRNGISTSEKEVATSGSIDVSFEQPNSVQITCADWDKDSDGAWAGQGHSAWKTSQYVEAKDSDIDGVYNFRDQCSNTPRGINVNDKGCIKDSDGDGVKDNRDQCINTGDQGYGLKDNGCPIEDSDGDGVANPKDDCPSTSNKASVDNKGCAVDSDGDGIPDHKDDCPQQGDAGMGLTANGCPVQDSDGDGISNKADKCPEKYGTKNNGCQTLIDQILSIFGLLR